MITNISQHDNADIPHMFMIICASEDEKGMLEQTELGIVALRSAVLTTRSSLRFSLLVDNLVVGEMFRRQLEMWPADILR
jgi:hypothetical protein